MEYKENLTDKDLEGLTDDEKGELIANSSSLTSTMWMSYEEAMFEKEWYARREQELLRSWGLSWLIDFCTPSNKENGLNTRTSNEGI
jgi:hypothetical protein